MTLVESIAAYVLEILPSEELPALAVTMLESGLESPSVMILAGEQRNSDPRDLRDFFEKALREISQQLPTRIEAAETMKRYYASQVVNGQLTPERGASFIVNKVFHQIMDTLPDGKYLGESFGIARLIGLFYDYDDVSFTDSNSIKEIDRSIIEECILLLGKQAP